jgi:hypothetical protein
MVGLHQYVPRAFEGGQELQGFVQADAHRIG